MKARLLMAVAVTGIMSSGAFLLAQDSATQGQTQSGTQGASQQSAAAGQSAAPQKNWKDRNEYDLYVSAAKETDPQKRLDLLNQWASKYPTSDFAHGVPGAADRRILYLVTYAALNQPQKVMDTAKELLADDPNNFQALYYVTLLGPQITPPTPDVLDQSEKGASGLIAAIPTQFAAEKKPAQVSQTDWDKAKTDTDALAHTTLGWVAMQRKDWAKAETEFTQSLKENPAAGQVSYWLGTSVLSEKDPSKQAAALYDFARAAAYDGPGALNAAGRAQVKTYLTKAYTDYHGSADGLDQLMNQAKSAPVPPEGFKVMSTADAETAKAQAQADLAKSNPSLALWMSIQQQLSAPDGQTYFDQHMKGAETPSFTGTLVSASPETRPKTLVLSIADASGKTADATIELDAALPGKADPGTKITFEKGIPQSFTTTPFMVTFKVEKANVKGWPGKEAPARRPVRRRG